MLKEGLSVLGAILPYLGTVCKVVADRIPQKQETQPVQPEIPTPPKS